MKRRFSSKQYAERLRRQRRRLYLQDGVLSVRFIKFVEEQEAPHCFVFDCPENAFYLTDGIAHCWQHRGKAEREAEADRQKSESAEEWAASLDMPSPPWPSPEQEEEEEFDYSELAPDVGPFPSFYTHDRLPWE